MAKIEEMVSIPLSEYKKYIEDRIKPPMVEIEKSEYDALINRVGFLESQTSDLQDQNTRLWDENGNLRTQLTEYKDMANEIKKVRAVIEEKAAEIRSNINGKEKDN